MTSPKLVCQPRGDTTDSWGFLGLRRRLPDDLLRQASKRLQILALVASALWIVGSVLWHLALYSSHPEDPLATSFSFPDAIAASAAVASFALYAYLRKHDRSPTFVMNLGLLYLLTLAFDLGVLIHWGPPAAMPLDPSVPELSVGRPVDPDVRGTAARRALEDARRRASRRLHGLDRHGVESDLRRRGLRAVAQRAHHALPQLSAARRWRWSSRAWSPGSGQQVSREREMGSYRLGEMLGRGGMGEVYRATHRMLARPAAIKLIRSEVLGADDGGPRRRSPPRGSGARPRPRPGSVTPHRASSTTSA